MLFLTFRNELRRRSTTVAAPSFRLAGDCIENGRGQLVARHIGGDWLLNEELFPTLECTQPVQCLFEGGGNAWERQGPVRQLELNNATLTGAGKPLARLSDDESMWLSAASSQRYSRISITAAA